MPGRDTSGDPGRTAAEDYVDRVVGAAPRETFTPRRAAVDEVRLYTLDRPAAWLLVTLGLADLGFELTLRLPRDDEEVPTWAVDFLLSLANYSRRSRHPFEAGHTIDLRGPIKLDADTAITAAAVTVDPALGALGQVAFLEIVGLTADELELCRSWQTDSVLGLLRRGDTRLTTRLDRTSLLDDASLREAAEAGVAAQNRPLDELGVASMEWRWRGHGPRRILVVTLGAGAATALGPALRRNLSHEGAMFSVVGDPGELRFTVGAGDGWQVGDGVVEITVTEASVEPLADLFNGRTGSGSLPGLAGVRFTVIA